MKIKFIFKDEVVDFCIKPETFVQIKLAKGAKGENGKDGKDGQDGYTPVKGVDYFTEADKEELLSGVEEDIASLKTNKADKSEIPDVSDYVKNTDYATSSKGGVIKVSGDFATTKNTNGYLQAATKTHEQYESMSNNAFIGKGTLENVITGKQLINQTTLDESQAEQDAEVQALQDKVDLLESLIPTEEASGESLTLSNTARYPFKEFNVGGNTKQQSYTGKNILETTAESYTLPASSTTYQKIYNTKPYLEAGTKYYISYDIDNASASNTRSTPRLYLNQEYVQYPTANSNLTVGRKVWEFTPTVSGNYEVQYWLQGSNTAVKVSKFMISTSSDTTYEPYVGGQASPNPSYPQSVENVSGEGEVKVENKNWFNVNNTLSPSNKGFSFSSYGQNININGAYNGSSSNAVACSFCGDFKSANYLNYITPSEWITLKAGTYTLSSKIVSGSYSEMTPMLRICKKSESQPYSFIIATSINTSASFTLEEETECSLGIMVGSLTKDISKFNNLILNIQLEQGSTATSYEPHEEQTATFPLEEGQVLHLGDTLEDDGIHQRRFTRVFDGTETTWIKNSLAFEFSLELIIKKSAQTIGLSSHFIQSFSWSSSNAAYRGKFQIDYIYNKFKLMPTDESITTIDLWKAYLAEQYSNGKPVTIEYELETEIIIPYTQEQQEAYDKIKDLYSYKGTTHISSSNEPSPVFEVVYRKSLE